MLLLFGSETASADYLQRCVPGTFFLKSEQPASDGCQNLVVQLALEKCLDSGGCDSVKNERDGCLDTLSTRDRQLQAEKAKAESYYLCVKKRAKVTAERCKNGRY